MKRTKTKKMKSYICVVCGKGKKSTNDIKCCGKNMVAKEKGSWNM